MTNLVSKISNQEAVKSFGITEVFFMNGEFYTTSNYTIPFDMSAELEAELSQYNTAV